MSTVKQLEIPFPKEKPSTKIPFGTRIKYPWYRTEVFGEIVEDDKRFPKFQCARLKIQGVKVLTIINPNKAIII